MMSFPTRFISFFALLVAVAPVLWAQSAPVARLQPEKAYRATVVKTLAGNDGFREIIPSTNEQIITVETEEQGASGVPAVLTVFRASDEGQASSGETDWRFRFTIAPDGDLREITVLDAQEPLSESIAYAMLSKHLAQLLFVTDYRLKEGTLPNVTIMERGEADGAVTFKYTIAQNEERSAGGQPISASVKGNAKYDSALGLYTQRLLKHEDRIYVAEDAIGEEKEVVMRRDLSISVSVTDR